MRSWKDALIGLVAGMILVPVAAFCYFYFGLAPVGTKAPPMPFEKFLANAALRASIARAGPQNPPVEPTESNLRAGAVLYREDCAVCHGLPGQPKSAVAKGMYPAPPQLLAGQGVTDDPVSETYWKVRNGIRLTGMPSFEASLSDLQIWQVSQVLANADKLPDPVRQDLARRPD
jgi:thiosulfate dehydrogenase